MCRRRLANLTPSQAVQYAQYPEQMGDYENTIISQQVARIIYCLGARTLTNITGMGPDVVLQLDRHRSEVPKQRSRNLSDERVFRSGEQIRPKRPHSKVNLLRN